MALNCFEGLQDSAPKKGIGVASFYETLAAKLPSFEHRKEQYDLTLAMAQALRNKQHLAAQAPTGTGKSFAVGGAIISEFLGTGRRAIIATANNSLLEQYARKDLPFLQSLFPQLRWARAKGKNNYACVDKGEKLFSNQTLLQESKGMHQLREWYDNTETGDKEEITFNVTAEEWARINVDDTCTGRKCAFFNECHYYREKALIKNADIIVTNTHLLLMDLLNPQFELFPPAHALIFDEAHELEDIAIGQLESGLTALQIANYLTKAKKEFGVPEEATIEITNSIAALFTTYRNLLDEQDEVKIIIPGERLRDLTLDFQNAMNRLAGEVSMFKTKPDTRERKAQDNLIQNIKGAGTAALSIVTPNQRYVSWVERTKTDVKVVTCPYRVADKLNKTIFAATDIPVICLSATLGMNKSGAQFQTGPNGELVALPKFDQFRRRIGMSVAAEFDCPSPFDYQKNCVLYLPKPPLEVKKPQDKGYTLWMLDQIVQLVELSRGRALILTTSNAALKQISNHISSCLPFPVKAQGSGQSNSQLINWFKQTNNSVLVGTASFWQGISIEGDDLKLVIIDKLPFSPQGDPIQKARDNWYQSDPAKKSRAFMELQVFPATIKLNQGFGRLIRTKTDTGVVAILDPRLTYGGGFKNSILASFPKAMKVTDINHPKLIQLLK